MAEVAEVKKVDALGDQCPIPVVKAKKVLDASAAGDVVEAHVDNEIAVQNLTKLARSRQCESRSEKLEEKHFVVRITVNGQGAADGGQAQQHGTGAGAGTGQAQQHGTSAGTGQAQQHGTSAGTGQGAAGAQTQQQSSGAGQAAAGPGEADNAQVCCSDARDRSIVVVSSAAMGTGNDELGKVLMKGFIYALSQLDTLPEKILFYNGGVTLTTEGSDSLEDLKEMEAQGVKIYSCGTCLNYYGLSEKLKVGEVTNMYSIVEAMAGASKIIRP